MRRRIRSAALPVHRHALPQVALDAGLVALAYYLAYRLRFDGGIPERYDDLFSRTITFAICGSVTTFALFGLYRHWMRYSSQREYLQIAQAVAVSVFALVGYVAVVQPKLISTPEGDVSVTVPTGVLVLFGLLMLVFTGALRYVTHLVYERPLRGYRARRDARSVLIVGAGDGPCVVLCMSSRENQQFGPYGEYKASEAATRHGASVGRELRERSYTRYREGWLPAP